MRRVVTHAVFFLPTSDVMSSLPSSLGPRSVWPHVTTGSFLLLGDDIFFASYLQRASCMRATLGARLSSAERALFAALAPSV